MLNFVGVRSYWTLVSKGSTHVHPLSEGQETKKPRKKKVSAWEAANFIPSWGRSSSLVSLKNIYTPINILCLYIYIYIPGKHVEKIPHFFSNSNWKTLFFGVSLKLMDIFWRPNGGPFPPNPRGCRLWVAGFPGWFGSWFVGGLWCSHRMRFSPLNSPASTWNT